MTVNIHSYSNIRDAATTRPLGCALDKAINMSSRCILTVIFLVNLFSLLSPLSLFSISAHALFLLGFPPIMSNQSSNHDSRPHRPTRLKVTYKAATNHDIYLVNKDHANAAKINKMTLEARAKNTQKGYIPKQQEFIAWTRKSNYLDGETVTEIKLLSFLEEEVIHRPLRKRGKMALTAEEIEL